MTGHSLDDALAAAKAVEGWLTTEQIARLHHAAAARTSGQRIVEIGSFRGRSTIALAMGAPDGVDVVAIDPHAGSDRGPQELRGFEAEASADHEAFTANLEAAGVAARVRHVREFSARAHAAVDGSIGMLFIDGAHRFGPARADIRDWGARVDDRGTMLIHDSFSSIGVTLAIVRELMFGRRFRYVGRSRSLAEYRADLGSSWSARAANIVRQLAQLPWFAKNVAVKVLITLHVSALVQRLTGRRLEWPY